MTLKQHYQDVCILDLNMFVSVSQNADNVCKLALMSENVLNYIDYFNFFSYYFWQFKGKCY